MSEEPIIDVANVFGVGQIGRTIGLEDDILIESRLREVTPAQQAARETAESVRRLVRELETASASIEDLGSVARQLDELSEYLARRNHDSATAGNSPNAVYQAHRLREHRRDPHPGQMRIAVAVGLEDLRPAAVNVDLGHRAHHRVGVGRSVIE
jgi:hypothetical protein